MQSYKVLSSYMKSEIVNQYSKLGYGSQHIIQQQLDISARAIARVLKEAGVNTKRKNSYTLNESFFSIIDNEKKAYILGLIYADGFNGGINHIAIGNKSEEYLREIADIIEYTGEIKPRTSGYGTVQYMISFSSKQMADDLAQLSVVTGKAETVETLPQIPKELIRHFIRGYFDGDGSVYQSTSSTKNKYGKRYTYQFIEVEIIGNRKFLETIGEELKEIGITYTFKKSNTPYMEYIRIKGGRNLRTLADYFYKDATIYLGYKHATIVTPKTPLNREGPSSN